MSRRVLGKRSHSSFSSPPLSRSSTPVSKSRRESVALELPSPDPTPNPKRVKRFLMETEEEDCDGNKENIPPEPILGSANASRLSLVTPPSTPGSMPLDQMTTEATSLHTLAGALLRSQAIGSTPLVGRELERKQILDFLKPFLAQTPSHDITSLYISGTPGTGKTALIHEILTSITSQHADDMDVDNQSLRVLYVNCMSLDVKDGMTGIWERCVEQLSGQKAKKRGTASKMDWNERFANLLRAKKCVLVLDEIDFLMTSTSSEQIFNLASDHETRSCLRVIGISNTHTLSHAKPTAHTQTIHFQPYTAAQMKLILGSRLEALSSSGFDASKVFPASTIGLLAFKVANETGDIRTMFSVARRAFELAAAGSHVSSAITVAPAHVLAALEASNTSINSSRSKLGSAETITRVRNLGLHSRFALVTLLLATKRVASGLSLSAFGSSTSSRLFKENVHRASSLAQRRSVTTPAFDLTTLHGFYSTILNNCGHEAFHSVGRTEFGDLLGLLEGNGLVELSQGRSFGNKAKSPSKGKGTQTVSMANGVREEELVRGLVGPTSCIPEGGTTVNVREEEVKNVWERELRRLEMEVKAKFGEVAKRKADFEGAEED